MRAVDTAGWRLLPRPVLLLGTFALLGALAPLACNDSSPASAATDDTTAAAADAGFGDPAAPGQDCPDAFDPDAVYVVLEHAGFESNILLFADVEQPEQECAFAFSGARDEAEVSDFAVRNGDGQMLRIRYDENQDDASDLYEANPDPLERREGSGLWSSTNWSHSDANDVLVFRDLADDECAADQAAPAFMTYGPSGELGYLCRDAPGLRAFDGRLISDTGNWRPLAFLDDGRILAVSPGPGNNPNAALSIVTASGDGPVIPVMSEPGINVSINAVQWVDGSLRYVAEVADGDGGTVGRFRLEGEVLVLEETYPRFDIVPDQFGMDRTGRVTVLGSRWADKHVLVMRLDPAGNTVLYETPDLDDGDAWQMPESSGAVVVRRLIQPP